MANTRYGLQPARPLLYQAGYSVRRAAEIMGELPAHLQNCLMGRVRPSATVREELPGLVGKPLEELFTPEAIAEPASNRARAGRASWSGAKAQVPS